MKGQTYESGLFYYRFPTYKCIKSLIFLYYKEHL